MIDCCVKKRRTLQSIGASTLIKTWRTPIEKASGDDPEAEYKWLHGIADGAAEEIREAFLKAIERIRGTVKVAQLKEALEGGNVDEVMRILAIDEQIADAMRTEMVPALEDTMIEAGRTAPTASLPKGGELTMRFDLTNPKTIQHLRDYEFRLIRQVSDDTRNSIRQVVRDSMQFGGHPREQARTIRTMIGLTDRQAQAVANFRRKLEEGDRGALDHELRDRRFDPTLRRALGETGEGLDKDQVDTMVQRYADRMLTARAENIARTETINAAQAGQQMAWEQAADKGLLSRVKLRQGWLVTPYDRLCVICAAIPLLNPDGVPLGGMFQTPVGPVARPTVHPQCRCSLYLMAF